jgi:glycosyltransferase involved in cell wall biosynthesis
MPREAAPATCMTGDGRSPVVAHVFPTFAVGGAQVRFAAIANHFGRRFRHIVVSLDGDLACRERLDPGLDVTFPSVPAGKNAMLANAWRYRGLLRQWRPDVLVTGNWGSVEFALGNLLPVTRHIHITDGFGPEERNAQIPRRVLVRRLALSRSLNLFPSQNLVRIARDVWRLPPAMVRYVPNGIDLARFATDGARRGGGGPVIGTVAALREEKNLGRLIRAFAHLPGSSGCRLAIVGDGPERPGLAALAESLGVAERVDFLGHRTDTPELYAGFDIFALSSDTEQMPLSVIEAMASGLPVVSTDVGDVRLMVAAENADCITPLDDSALSAGLAGLVADPAARRRLGAANWAKAQRAFDQAAMFATYGKLWSGESIPL